MSDDLFRATAFALPGAWPDEPWEGTGVAKVGPVGRGKIFCFFSWEGGIAVKCGRDRDEADEWLERFPDDAEPMAYVGKSGWNRLATDGAIPEEDLLEAIVDSYRFVIRNVPTIHRPPGWDL